MHPDDRARLEAAGAFDADDTEPFDEEYRMRAADGTYRWVHDTLARRSPRRRQLDYFLGFMTTSPSADAAQDRLRVAEERFRTIVEQTPAMTYQETCRTACTTATWSKRIVSPQIKGLLGYTQEEWARPGFWLEATHPDDLPRDEPRATA